jgi:CRP-like cAMP-binding protein
MTAVSKGRIVMIRNERYDDLIILAGGALEAFQEDRDGHQLIVETIRAPEAVASAMLFAPRPRIPVSLRAVETTRLFMVSRESILRLCSRHPAVLSNLLSDMGARTAFLAEKLRYQTFGSIRQKLANYLMDRIEQNETKAVVSKEHLADVFGVGRPSLSRVCAELVRDGVIDLDGRIIMIVNPDAVRSLAENLNDR